LAVVADERFDDCFDCLSMPPFSIILGVFGAVAENCEGFGEGVFGEDVDIDDTAELPDDDENVDDNEFELVRCPEELLAPITRAECSMDDPGGGFCTEDGYCRCNTFPGVVIQSSGVDPRLEAEDFADEVYRLNPF
jgi:hypothetical protein